MQIKVLKTTPKNIEKLVDKLLDIFVSIGIPVENTDRKLERMAKACMAVGQIRRSFTVFENKNIFKQKAKDIAWETEVWIADSPEHLVHFNGYKFLEIHK